VRDDVVRFEYRVWGTELTAIRQRIDELAESRQQERVTDLYLLGPNTEVNAKVRDGSLEVKRLLPTGHGFQRWKPSLRREPPFPVELVEELLRRLGDGSGTVSDSRLPESLAVSDLIKATSNNGLHTIEVVKERQLFTVDGTRAESTRVDCKAGQWWTVAGESTEADDLDRLVRRLGLDGLDNRSMNAHLYSELTATGESNQ